MGGSNDSHIYFARLVAADSFYFALLQYAQQFDLDGRRQVSDFIEKDRAAVGLFKTTGFIADRPGECTFDMTEEFALE